MEGPDFEIANTGSLYSARNFNPESSDLSNEGQSVISESIFLTICPHQCRNIIAKSFSKFLIVESD